MTKCAVCQKPVSDAFCCVDCAQLLARDLGDVAALERELELTQARQTRITGLTRAPRPRPTEDEEESPLPFDERATPAADALRNALNTSVRLVHVEPERWPADTMPSMAAWLLSHLEAIRHHEAAFDIVDDLRKAIRHAYRVIDRPAELMYAGPCDQCHADLYARPDSPEVTCAPCQLVYTVAERREWLLASAEDHLATASEIAGFLSAFHERIDAGLIRKWGERSRITAHGLNLRGRPMYRVGDVLDRIAGDTARRDAG